MDTNGSSPIRVRVVESEQEFGSMSATWEDLLACAKSASIFMSFDWQHLWWREYGGKRPLRLLLAFEDRTLAGILALYIDTVQMLGCPVRVLRLVGTGGDTFPDDLGALLMRGREHETATALAREILRMPGWDVLLLQDMDPACEFTQIMRVASETQGLQPVFERAERIAYAELPDSWDSWLQSLHRDRRYRIRNARKRLNAAYSARFFLWSDPVTLAQGVDRLAALHRKRWQSAGQSHAFSTRQYVDFHRAVMTACFARDRLRLYCLELNGEVVAMSYYYLFRNGLYLMQSGFDPSFGHVSPGQVLLGHVIEHAISQHYRVLDFLRGDHRYKEELATGERETISLRAFRLSPGALAYRARRLFLPAIKRQLVRAFDRVRTAPEASG